MDIFYPGRHRLYADVEPSASFWDCPEFILSAAKLEVGHPPGAPFFMLTGNVISQLAGDPAQIALLINIMNALLSAGCILFLFWTIHSSPPDS